MRSYYGHIDGQIVGYIKYALIDTKCEYKANTTLRTYKNAHVKRVRIPTYKNYDYHMRIDMLNVYSARIHLY